MQTIANWLENHIKDYNSKNEWVVGCIESLGVSRKSVINEISRKKLVFKKGTKKKKAKERRKKERRNKDNGVLKTKGRSLNEFKQQYDKNTYVPKKIGEALKKLGDAWEYEAEFVARAGINYTDLNLFRSMFDDNFVLIKKEGKKVWCGSIELADKLKEIV